MNKIDIYCLPSHFEGMPFSLIEAFAAGKQVIATDVVGNKELIQKMKQGTLVEPNNPNKLAEAIKNEIDALKRGLLNRNDIINFPFSVKSMMQNYENLFSKFN